MCKAIEDMKKNYAEIKIAEEIVNAVESAMKNFKVSLEDACAGLNYSLEKYNTAKKLITKL